MARIDGILRLVLQQKATEMRIPASEPPKLVRDGAPLTFTLPPMDEPMLLSMVEDLLNDQQNAAVKAGEEVVFSYGGKGLGTFWLKLLRNEAERLELIAWPSDGGTDPEEDGPNETTGPTEEMRAAIPTPPTRPEPVEVSEDGTAPGPRATTTPVSPLVSNRSRTPGAALSALLYRATTMGASDLHVADGESPTVRVSGQLRALPDGPIRMAYLLDELLDPAAQATLTAGRSLDLQLALDNVGNYRANLYRHQGGLAGAFRVLQRFPPKLSDLGLPSAVRALADLPHGLVILCGATGSGKSTTMAALAQARLDTRPTLLISLEDPIEYSLRSGSVGSLVRQRAIGEHTPDFHTGLRDALREDPDLLLIGEMRDTESITRTLTAAETGHLVMTSLHSRSAASAVERIVDVYPPQRQSQIRVQLADALRAVVAQKLVPHRNGAGRVVATEILRVNHGVANLIREGKTAQIISAIQSGKGSGMLSLERSLAELVRDGTIRSETARAAANDPTTLSNYLGRI